MPFPFFRCFLSSGGFGGWWGARSKPRASCTTTSYIHIYIYMYVYVYIYIYIDFCCFAVSPGFGGQKRKARLRVRGTLRTPCQNLRSESFLQNFEGQLSLHPLSAAMPAPAPAPAGEVGVASTDLMPCFRLLYRRTSVFRFAGAAAAQNSHAYQALTSNGGCGQRSRTPAGLSNRSGITACHKTLGGRPRPRAGLSARLCSRRRETRRTAPWHLVFMCALVDVYGCCVERFLRHLTAGGHCVEVIVKADAQLKLCFPRSVETCSPNSTGRISWQYTYCGSPAHAHILGCTCKLLPLN